MQLGLQVCTNWTQPAAYLWVSRAIWWLKEWMQHLAPNGRAAASTSRAASSLRLVPRTKDRGPRKSESRTRRHEQWLGWSEVRKVTRAQILGTTYSRDIVQMSQVPHSKD